MRTTSSPNSSMRTGVWPVDEHVDDVAADRHLAAIVDHVDSLVAGIHEIRDEIVAVELVAPRQCAAMGGGRASGAGILLDIASPDTAISPPRWRRSSPAPARPPGGAAAQTGAKATPRRGRIDSVPRRQQRGGLGGSLARALAASTITGTGAGGRSRARPRHRQQVTSGKQGSEMRAAAAGLSSAAARASTSSRAATASPSTSADAACTLASMTGIRSGRMSTRKARIARRAKEGYWCPFPPRRARRLAAHPVGLDRRRRRRPPWSEPATGSASGSRPPAAPPSGRRATAATRWRSASCGPSRADAPTVLFYGHYDVQSPRPAELGVAALRARRVATAACMRAAPPTTRATSCRSCTWRATWLARASCPCTCASSSRARRRSAATTCSTGSRPTSAAPTARSFSTRCMADERTPAITHRRARDRPVGRDGANRRRATSTPACTAARC